MSTPNVRYLREHGPSTMGEMPHDKLSVRDKQAGVWKFGGSWSAAGSTTGGQTIPVFYIRDRHFPRQVVRAWMHANPSAVEKLPRLALLNVLYRNGSEFEAPVKELVDQAKA